MQVVRRAYAKVNLALAVGPPEPVGSPAQGMHPIASWMHSIELFDTIRVERQERSSFAVSWADDAPRMSPIDWAPESDLCVRSLKLIEARVGRALPVRLEVAKRIPVGGGLGGGSADAAATMLAIRELYQLPLSIDELIPMSAKLGSDIAYFLDEAPPRPALVTGIADRVQRLDRPLAGRAIVLIFPQFGCPTGAVYRAFDAIGPGALRENDVPRAALNATLTELFNDLDAAAARVQPALTPLRSRIAEVARIPVHMSGSGSTLFVLPEAGDAEQIAKKIGSEVADISILSTRLI